MLPEFRYFSKNFRGKIHNIVKSLFIKIFFVNLSAKWIIFCLTHSRNRQIIDSNNLAQT